MTAYCAVNDVLEASGRVGRTLTTAETTAVNNAIAQARGWLEGTTGTFFDSRHQQVTTQTVQVRQKRIFTHAPVISFDSGQITEAGNVLTLGSDFLLYQPVIGPGYLEKIAPDLVGNWSGMGMPSYPPSWTNVQQGIVMTGMFGYSTVPNDIVKVSAWYAARIMGWITVSYTDADGAQKAVLNLKEPDWVTEILSKRRLSPWDEQYFGIVDL